MFLTGLNEWRRHDAWPPKNARAASRCTSMRAAALAPAAPAGDGPAFDEYVSDPERPVPYVGYIAGGMTCDYMTEDQRFAAQRPDVLVYQTAAARRRRRSWPAR